MNKSILSKIREKREFSQLPEKDIEMAFSHFEKRQTSEDEKIKLTRELLRKVFSAFISKKLLSLKNKEPEWILRKHISTRERIKYYPEIYRRILNELNKKINIIDLGAGINGFSYNYFKKLKYDVKYIAVESVGQLTELMNFYFKSNKINANAIHLSLFELDKIKKLIKEQKGEKVIFLFKVIDALEMIKRDYSKELISEITPLADRVVLSFATKSLGNREKFNAKRSWIVDFIKENFIVLDDFEIAGERYIVFQSSA